MLAEQTIVFDIETGPLPEHAIAIPPFDPDAVKVGGLLPATAEVKIEKARENHLANAVKNAALHAHTGEVLAIGYKTHEDPITILDDGNEHGLLMRFWSRYENNRNRGRRLVGFDNFRFDQPFLMQRSFIRGVRVPESVRHGRWWDNVFVDLKDIWTCGDRSSFFALDTLAKALGVGRKTPGLTGADFARLYKGTPEEREKALNYLRNDLEITWKCAERML